MKIRKAKETDRSEILNIHIQAFGKDEGPVIAQLVKNLLDDETAMPILSLVAFEQDKLLGHILFTKVEVAGADNPIIAQILAPLAILPGEQNKGIGQELINEGLRLLKDAGTELVFVLGHPSYYPRCGFIPAGRLGYEAPYHIPDENADAWMVLGLVGDVMEKFSGRVKCAKVLDEPQYWRE